MYYFCFVYYIQFSHYFISCFCCCHCSFSSFSFFIPLLLRISSIFYFLFFLFLSYNTDFTKNFPDLYNFFFFSYFFSTFPLLGFKHKNVFLGIFFTPLHQRSTHKVQQPQQQYQQQKQKKWKYYRNNWKNLYVFWSTS